jgi:hypothetical protein
MTSNEFGSHSFKTTRTFKTCAILIRSDETEKQITVQNYFSEIARARKNCKTYLAAVHARAFRLRVNRCSGVVTEPETERS